MSVIKLTSQNFESEIKEYQGAALVDFYADWCGPCQMMSPVIDKIADELEGQVKVGKVNTDENLELAESFGIMSIPTIMIFKNGNIEKVFNGLTSKSEIMDVLKNIL